jgi:hypothetical protein
MAAVIASREPSIKPEKVGQNSQTSYLRVNPWLVGFFRVLAALSAWIIVDLQLFRANSGILGLQYAFYFAIGVTIFCAKVRGNKVFARTPVDLAFGIWIVLAVVSQLWASLVLNRVLNSQDIGGYLSLIINLWVMFRVGFALNMVDPRTSTGAFLKAVSIGLGLACLVGILQGYGPGPLKQWAIHFGTTYGTVGGLTDVAANGDTVRPIAVFTGPNIFGFLNLVGMCIIIGLTAAQGRNISSKSVWMAAFGLALFFLGTVAAQSRAALAVCLLLILAFMYLMLRIGRRNVVITGLIAVCVLAIAGMFFMQRMKLDHLQSTFQQKLTDDDSFRERQLGFKALTDQAMDLAPLGAGFTQRGMLLVRTGDSWSRTNGIDDAYFQAYINHGIPGILHIVFFFCTLWWGLKLAKNHRMFHIRVLKYTCTLLLLAYVAYGFTGVRHAKVETGVYLMIFFGLLYGGVYGEKFFGEDFRRRWSSVPELPGSVAA